MALAFSVMLGCSSSAPPTKGEGAAPAQVGSADSRVQNVLASAANIPVERFGQQARVEGVYRFREVLGKGGRDAIATWPVVVLDDGSEVMIGSLWLHKGVSPHARDDWKERRVVLIGTLHPSPPLPEEHAQNFLSPTVSPVESLALAP